MAKTAKTTPAKSTARKTTATPSAVEEDRGSNAEVEGIRHRHPERVIDKSTTSSTTTSAPSPCEFRNRPVSLVRWTACFSSGRFPEALKIPELKQLDPASRRGQGMVEIDSFAASDRRGATSIELHTWNATTRRNTGHPPMASVFDLDPGDG